MAKAVTIVDSGGIGVTNTESLSALATPMTPVDSGGVAVTLVDSGGLPIVLIEEDGTLWSSLLAAATEYLGGIEPDIWLDFVNNRAFFSDEDVGEIVDIPGYSFTRATTGYGRTSAGVLVPFASGALRRTDRGVLIEAAATNLLLQSQTFGTTWTVSRGSVTSDVIAAPDGALTADRFQEDSATGEHGVNQTITKAASAIQYTVSCFLKAGERTWAIIQVLDGAVVGNRIWFNLATGAVGSTTTVGGGFTGVSARIVAHTNGWYRCVVTFTSTTNTTLVAHVLSATGDTVISYAGDNASGFYLWGAQLEAAADATSYIPTTTTTQTRNADVFSIGSLSLAYPLSLFVEFERASDTGGTVQIIQADDGTNNERVDLRITSADLCSATMIDGGVSQAAPTVGAALAVGTNTKLAARYNTNSVHVCRDGTLGTEDTSATLPATSSTLWIGQGLSGNQAAAFIKRIAIFNSALANADLQTVTT